MLFCAKDGCGLSGKIQSGVTCTSCGGPLTPVTPRDREDAARYYVAINAACRGGSADETIANYYSATGASVDCGEVLSYAQEKRRAQAAFDYFDAWPRKVCDALSKAETSPLFESTLSLDRVKFLRRAREEVHMAGLARRFRTGGAQAGDGFISVPVSMLSGDVTQLAFTLGHETGHYVDDKTRGERHALTPMHHALRLGSFGEKMQDKEYFADAFATLVLLLSGVGGPAIVRAAMELFATEEDFSSDHPSGQLRIENIQEVIRRHVGLVIEVVTKPASGATPRT